MSSPEFRLIPLPYEDVDQRCRCGKRMVIDVGGGVTGQSEALIWCLNCSPLMPETSWALYGVEQPYHQLLVEPREAQ